MDTTHSADADTDIGAKLAADPALAADVASAMDFANQNAPAVFDELVDKFVLLGQLASAPPVTAAKGNGKSAATTVSAEPAAQVTAAVGAPQFFFSGPPGNAQPVGEFVVDDHAANAAKLTVSFGGLQIVGDTVCHNPGCPCSLPKTGAAATESKPIKVAPPEPPAIDLFADAPALDTFPRDDIQIAAWHAYNEEFGGVVTLDEHGWATRPGPPISTDETLHHLKTIRAIAAAFSSGTVIGHGRSFMASADRKRWTRAWFNGDLATCFAVESKYASPGLNHPGHPDRPGTHRIIWASLDGQVPAGQAVPGEWPALAEDWGVHRINNYCLAARNAHLSLLDRNTRRRWAKAHLRGDAIEVASINKQATDIATLYTTFKPYDQPTWKQLPEVSRDLDTTAPYAWSITALREYATTHDLPFVHLPEQLKAQVLAYRLEALRRAAEEAARIELHDGPDQPVGGYHRKLWLRDQHDRPWLFKPAADEAHTFRPETEHQAHVLARLWGYPTAESRLVTHNGLYGQIQRGFDVARSFTDPAATLRTLTPDQLAAVGQEHVLDWALDNDDTHAENLLITTSGQIVGIDKGRAFRYFGSWPGLAATRAADTNCALVYTVLYQLIRSGEFDRTVVDHIYGAVLHQARRMEELPDDQVEACVRAAVTNRPHFNPSHYQRVHPGAPGDADALVAAVLERKHHLAEQFEDMWRRIYTATGWVPPEPATLVGRNTQGHVVYTSLHSPEVHQQVTLTKAYGTPVFVAGTGVEDAHVLLWREFDTAKQQWRYRGEAKLRADAYATADTWCGERVTSAPPLSLRNNDYYYNVLLSTLGATRRCTRTSDWSWIYVGEFHEMRDTLTELIDRNPETMARWPTQWNCREEAVKMAHHYQPYVTQLQQHLDQRTAPEPDFEITKFVYTPPELQPAEPNVKVEYLPCARAKAAHPQPGDGELHVHGTMLGTDEGQVGKMFLLTLATGEQIEFRANDAPKSAQGTLRFTVVADEPGRFADGLRRVTDQLAIMGVPFTPATAQDLELFYWRHLGGILNNRCDTNTDVTDMATFWAAVPTATEPAATEPAATEPAATEPAATEPAATEPAATEPAATEPAVVSPDDELTQWRAAFALISPAADIAAFTDSRRWLPQFMHQDLRAPARPCGKPYWDRYDVTGKQVHQQKLLCVTYRRGPKPVVDSGVALATEARIRARALWHSGTSSTEDMNAGSAGFVFVRQHLSEHEGFESTVYFHPRVLRRTTNYAYNSDRFGRINERRLHAPWHWSTYTNCQANNNELLVKDAIALLDDVELMMFFKPAHREEALYRLAELGITELRGIPMEQRCLVRGDWGALIAAIEMVKASWSAE